MYGSVIALIGITGFLIWNKKKKEADYVFINDALDKMTSGIMAKLPDIGKSANTSFNNTRFNKTSPAPNTAGFNYTPPVSKV